MTLIFYSFLEKFQFLVEKNLIFLAYSGYPRIILKFVATLAFFFSWNVKENMHQSDNEFQNNSRITGVG